MKPVVRAAFLAAVALLMAAFAVPAIAAPVRYGLMLAGNYGQLGPDGNITVTFNGTSDAIDDDAVSEMGWELGGVMVWPRDGAWRLETGARYIVHAGRSETSSDFGSTTTTHTRLEYAIVPVHAIWSPHGLSRLHLSAGGDVGYLLRAQSKYTATLSAEPLPTPALDFATIFESVQMGDWYEVTSYCNRWNTELSAGLGWELGSGPRVVWLDLRYAQGLSDVFDEDLLERTTRRLTLSATRLW